MPWFERHLQGQNPQQAFAMLANLTSQLQIPAILTRCCGKTGLRRFIVRLERRGMGTRIVGVETERLANGGPPTALDTNAPALEQAVTRLAEAMPQGWDFHRLAIGVLREQDGVLRPSYRFDEDADTYRLKDIRLPKGEGIPTEDLAYLKAQEIWTDRVAALRSRWVTAAGPWNLHAGRLIYQDQSWLCEPVATWVPRTGDFTWLLAEPCGDEAPFFHRELVLELGPTVELVAFAAARLGVSRVFQGTLNQPAGMQFFAGVRD